MNSMYASIADMATRFGLDALQVQAPPPLGSEGAGSPEADAGTGMNTGLDTGLDTEAITAALTDSSEIVDGHLVARYQLPLDPVPAPVRRWCVDIAWYYLHRFEPPNYVRKAFEDALAGLKAVARGDMHLQGAGAVPPAPQGESAVQGAGPDRLFSENSLKGY